MRLKIHTSHRVCCRKSRPDAARTRRVRGLPAAVALGLALACISPTAQAQLAPPEDFFNSGAQLYISNNIPSALQRVEEGLSLYPQDTKLKDLEKLLKQEQQQQNQQNQQQQKKSQQQQNKQSQQKQNSSQQQSQDQQSQDQQKQDEEKQKAAEQKKEEQQKQQKQQKSEAQKKDQEKKDQENAENQPLKQGQMTPEEAKRLLDSQKGNEQFLQMKPKPEDSSHSIKDW